MVQGWIERKDLRTGLHMGIEVGSDLPWSAHHVGRLQRKKWLRFSATIPHSFGVSYNLPAINARLAPQEIGFVLSLLYHRQYHPFAFTVTCSRATPPGALG